MSPFRAVLLDLNLSHTSGTSMNMHWIAFTLEALADYDELYGPAPVTYSSDPYRECLERIRNYQGFAAQELRRVLSPRVR